MIENNFFKQFKHLEPFFEVQKRMQPFIEMHMEAQKKLNAFFDAYLRLADGIEVLPKDGCYLGFEFIYEYLGVDYLNEIVCNWNIDETKNNFRNNSAGVSFSNSCG